MEERIQTYIRTNSVDLVNIVCNACCGYIDDTWELGSVDVSMRVGLGHGGFKLGRS